MRISLAGPVRLGQLAPLLHEPVPDVTAVPGGSPVSLLTRGLLARGHHVHVATLAGGIEAPLRLEGPRLRVDVGVYRPSLRARDVFREERRAVEDALRREGSDVAHAHWTYEFALGALASGVPTVVTVRDWAPVILRYHPHPYRVVRLGMAATVLRRAPVLTVTSPYMARLVSRWARRDAVLVPNALPDEDFEDVAERPWPRGDAPRLVSVNVGFGRRKNVGNLLRAFPLVRARYPGARLSLVGDGHGPGEDAERFTRDASLDTSGVEFRGRLGYDETMALVRASDVMVHPSREESFGLVLVEAMARGVAVVAGRDAGAVPWVCDDGRAGVLVDVESPEDIARGVDDVFRDLPAARARIVKAASQARRRFGLDAVCAAYEEVYAGCRSRAE